MTKEDIKYMVDDEFQPLYESINTLITYISSYSNEIPQHAMDRCENELLSAQEKINIFLTDFIESNTLNIVGVEEFYSKPLQHSKEYRLGDFEEDELHFDLPNIHCEDFTCFIVFNTNKNTPIITPCGHLSKIAWSGVDIRNNTFVPEKNKHYRIKVYWDGQWNAFVSSTKIVKSSEV